MDRAFLWKTLQKTVFLHNFATSQNSLFNSVSCVVVFNRPFNRASINHIFNKARRKPYKHIACRNKFIKIGCYIGVGGTLTFKNSKKLVEVVKEISINKILLETDSPYLAPEPVRGTINDPTNLKYVISKIAEIKGLTYESVRDTLNQNAIEFFGLKI